MYSVTSASFSKYSEAGVSSLYSLTAFSSPLSPPFMAQQISCCAYWDAKCCHYTAGKACTLCTTVAMMITYRANLPYKQRFKGKPVDFLAFSLDNSNSSSSLYLNQSRYHYLETIPVLLVLSQFPECCQRCSSSTLSSSLAI